MENDLKELYRIKCSTGEFISLYTLANEASDTGRAIQVSAPILNPSEVRFRHNLSL